MRRHRAADGANGTQGAAPGRASRQAAVIGAVGVACATAYLSLAVPSATSITLTAAMLGLSATLTRLAVLRARHRQTEFRSVRLSQLYSALSQCNQAIARCRSESELFEDICRAAVTICGMQMTWIGLLDDSKRLMPVAVHGQGMEYLRDLKVSADEADPHGRGPTGLALRSDSPYWCQDVHADPATVLWRMQSQRFGWKSFAVLPLHRGDRVIGALSLYGSLAYVFDAVVRDLLMDMVRNIDYALANLDRETERQRANEALRESEQRLRTVIETQPECVKTIDRSGNLLEMNAAGLAMIGADSLAQAQRHYTEVILPEYRDAFAALHARVMSGESGLLEFEIVGLRGQRRWLETHATPMRGADGCVTRLLAVTRDTTDRKQASDRIQHLAHYDALTGLPNRRLVENRARQAFSQVSDGHTLAVMFLDLDLFKDINDTLGHSAGDALLIELARRLRPLLSEGDVLARFGGDEFLILLPDACERTAAQTAQKVLDTIAEPYHLGPYDLTVSGSIGIALYPRDGTDFESLSKNADTAMYHVKKQGRRGYCFFTPQMQAGMVRYLKVVGALRQALPRNQFHLHYQPQMSMDDGKLIGVEALLRWNHPELGAVSPAEFIPVAEESGAILAIGEWVLRHAARQARIWVQAGYTPVIAVNLSTVQFHHADLPNLVSRILEEEDLPAQHLELELTEGVAMRDPQRAIAMIQELHERGVCMSIDDFGTGYSSLAQLKKFQVRKLKIDQSFVRDIATNAEDRAIVGAIVQMARNLGLLTIAEGVETAEQISILRAEGCNEMQGYYFSKPLSAVQFEQFARTRESYPHRLDA
ncbi:putative bifunctional diguanylate cyclase/phosphodiesterase [Cupriavidus pinatubonensis]|uniref:putative bifunctional diguanylate cyclase/phosphodiesterase n=1 Tax=Cupriavidus pinatubonensis TaxID=248026 RepID=UPI001CC43F95|nr:EAL domain-containing protein [Cupriavidus pinatubonensis]